MKIAINDLPLKNSHKYRGIGYYTNQLLESLKEEDSLEIQQFTRLSDIRDADIIHYPWFDLFFHTLPIRRRLPTIVTIHDVMPLIFPQHYPVGFKGKINFILQRIALSSCQYIITDSEVSRKDIIKYLKIEEKKVAVIPLATDQKFQVLKDESKLLYIKRKYQLPDQFLMYVGDANWIKNLPFLIQGFRQLLKSPALDKVKLVLVGGVFLKNVEDINHPELESLKLINKLIKKYGIEDKIIRPGQIGDEELVIFYNLASLYVQPSLYEGFGLPILQAFACGTPVISSDRGSLIEVGGQAAVYFDPTSLSQFTSLIQELLQNSSLRSKLSKLGFKQVSRFSWKKVADETKLIYLKAIKNG